MDDDRCVCGPCQELDVALTLLAIAEGRARAARRRVRRAATQVDVVHQLDLSSVPPDQTHAMHAALGRVGAQARWGAPASQSIVEAEASASKVEQMKVDQGTAPFTNTPGEGASRTPEGARPPRHSRLGGAARKTEPGET